MEIKYEGGIISGLRSGHVTTVIFTSTSTKLLSKSTSGVFSASFPSFFTDRDETTGEHLTKILVIFKNITDHETALL